MSKLRFVQKCPRCSGVGVSERIFENGDKSLYSFCCQDCGYLSNDEEAKALFEDAYNLYCEGLRERSSCEEILVEKEKWDKVMKESKKLFVENKRLRDVLEFILESTKKDNPSIEALRFVVYTALKDAEKCK